MVPEIAANAEGTAANAADRPMGTAGGDRRMEGPPEIELEKLISDSLYLDNQAHAVVSRMRDMDFRNQDAVAPALRRGAPRRARAGKRAAARVCYAARAAGLHYCAARAAQPRPARTAAAAGYAQERHPRLRAVQGPFRAIVAYNE